METDLLPDLLPITAYYVLTDPELIEQHNVRNNFFVNAQIRKNQAVYQKGDNFWLPVAESCQTV